jgi:hypothetical protein
LNGQFCTPCTETSIMNATTAATTIAALDTAATT